MIYVCETLHVHFQYSVPFPFSRSATFRLFTAQPNVRSLILFPTVFNIPRTARTLHSSVLCRQYNLQLLVRMHYDLTLGKGFFFDSTKYPTL